MRNFFDSNANERSTKQRITRASKVSKSNASSMTQSLFRYQQSQSDNKLKKISEFNFHQTLGSDYLGKWVRPESKQNYRRKWGGLTMIKGLKTNGKHLKQQSDAECNAISAKMISTELTNGKENKQHFLKDRSKQGHSARIVINSAHTNRTNHCTPKLKTDLPDDFLSLFAS